MTILPLVPATPPATPPGGGSGRDASASGERFSGLLGAPGKGGAPGASRAGRDGGRDAESGVDGVSRPGRTHERAEERPDPSDVAQVEASPADSVVVSSTQIAAQIAAAAQVVPVVPLLAAAPTLDAAAGPGMALGAVGAMGTVDSGQAAGIVRLGAAALAQAQAVLAAVTAAGRDGGPVADPTGASVASASTPASAAAPASPVAGFGEQLGTQASLATMAVASLETLPALGTAQHLPLPTTLPPTVPSTLGAAVAAAEAAAVDLVPTAPVPADTSAAVAPQAGASAVAPTYDADVAGPVAAGAQVIEQVTAPASGQPATTLADGAAPAEGAAPTAEPTPAADAPAAPVEGHHGQPAGDTGGRSAGQHSQGRREGADPAVTGTAPTASATSTGTTGTTGVTAAAPLLAAGDQPQAASQVTRQVFPEIQQLVSRGDGTHRITLVLAPEALGEVRVTLTMRGGEVQVRLSGGEHAQRALLHGAPELHRLLEQVGASRSEVLVGDQSSSSQPRSSDQGSRHDHLGSQDGMQQGSDRGHTDTRTAGTRDGDTSARDGAPRGAQPRSATDPAAGLGGGTRTHLVGVDVTM